MKKVYLIVECDVADYPEVEQFKAAEMALDSVWGKLLEGSDRDNNICPWYDFGNGGMTVQGVEVVSNSAVDRLHAIDAKLKWQAEQARIVVEAVTSFKNAMEIGQ